MAFRIEGIRNYVADKNYPDAGAVIERAKAAAQEFGNETMFSGGKIEQVLGSAERVKRYMDDREKNLMRYT